MKNLEKTRRSIMLDFYAGEIDNNEIVKLMELCDELLQLKTIPNYAASVNMSPNGVYKCRKDRIITIAGKMFVVAND